MDTCRAGPDTLGADAMLAAVHAGVAVEDDDAAYHTQLGEDPGADTIDSSAEGQPDACAEALGIPKVGTATCMHGVCRMRPHHTCSAMACLQLAP